MQFFPYNLNGFGLTFTLFYFVSNQQFAAQFSYHCTSLIFQHYVMCDTTRQNGGSGETDAQVKILIYHLLMALRGVYKKTGIVDNPVDTDTNIYTRYH